MEIVEIEKEGVKLIVHGIYSPYEDITEDHPPTPAKFEIMMIESNGVDITEIFEAFEAYELLEAIEKEAIKQIS